MKRFQAKAMTCWLIGLSAVNTAVAQTTSENYVKSETFIGSNKKTTAVNYYDGLGRPVLSAVTGSNNSSGYEYRLQRYDFGERIAKQFINAYGTGTPVYKDSAALNWPDTDPYRSTKYSYDGLERVTMEAGPGQAWHDNARYKRTVYGLNGTGEVRLFRVSGNTLTQESGANYTAGTLNVETHTDEADNETRVYKDMQGKVILERRINTNDNTNYDTYYAYDYLGNLRYVLPPLATDGLATSGSWTMSTAVLQKYAYYYEYDTRGRCTKKQLPGCGYVSMTYDTNDRLVASQDGNQRNASPVISTYYEYDALGRQTVMGTKTAAGVKTPLLETFYDDYTFLTTTESSKVGFNTGNGYQSTYATAPKGLQTGVRVHLLHLPSTTYVTAMYYDDLGNMIQSRSTNQLGGNDDDYIQYNVYTGKELNHKHIHSASGLTTHTEVYTYTYDHADRLQDVKYKLNSNAQVTLCTYTYDEVGRVKTRKLMNNAETVTYDYNIRDWQKKISSTRFEELIGYNETSGNIVPTNKYYGGNIGAIRWQTGNETKMRGYNFTYNPLGWLTKAKYQENGSSSSRYDANFWYDKMGNMTYMDRKGLQDGGGYDYIDDLEFEFNGNQLRRIDDNETDPTYSGAFNFPDGAGTSIEYTYDQNGNMTKDLNKKISSIQYNLLNLPRQITYQTGNMATYIYNAAGEKMSVQYNIGTGGYTNIYCGNVIYQNGVLKQILIDGGYITFSGSTPVYHYYLQDHLGNNRVVCNASGTIEQVNHYYPFGGLFGESTNGSTQIYKYNGKEFDRINGVDWYDYGARHMSPDIGRFTSIDPMAEKYYNTSPYAYCGNNPVNLIDPEGMDWVKSSNNDYLWMDDVTSYDTAPEGYTYIGATNKDLLADLNIESNLKMQTTWGGSIGVDGDEKFGGVITGSAYQLSADANVYPIIDINIQNSTSNNAMGIRFKGIRFETFFNQKGVSPNANFSLDYNGNMRIEANNNNIYTPLSYIEEPYIQQTGSISKSAIKDFNASEIKQLSFREISVEVGATNTSALITRPVTFTWNLMKQPTIKNK